ncbi:MULTISPECIES: PAS domain S-box protein [unclassified Methanoregula]|uniref:PAS domain S-box protein n=1 Tax=unclassified Methanoregula TaxID=2649730 RepID=UPI0009CD91CA|nr:MULTISPECIES: PAS domain S-box protein [unclassified Methanoregula]OPX61749.1 MAG: sensory histidine kinase AtoS [Methanoregula sp. PtaB.Bin085]OPY33942.1 MAG: sensory histidine kinase AtoS [Methanoregula sp. PtaU1.Bin006]
MPEKNGREIPENPEISAASQNDDRLSYQQESRKKPPDLRSLIQNLKESEKRLNLRCSLLQAIIDGANAAIFSVDPGYRYTNFNRKHIDLVRELYGNEISLGENLKTAFYVERDYQNIHELVRQAFAGDEGSVSDFFGDNAHNRRFIDISAYPICNETGCITGAAIIALDSTARKQHEMELIEREERFRRLAADAPDFLYRMSLPEGKYEFVSPEAHAFTGYTPEEFARKPGLLYELIHSSDKDAFGRQLELLIQGRAPPPAEFRIVHRNGTVRWGYFRTALVRDTENKPVAAEGFVTDITRLKTELAETQMTKDRFQAIVESADAGILVVDATTHIISDANPRAREMIGAPRENIIGAVCHNFICPAENGRTPVPDPGGKVDESERVIRTADGRTIPVHMSVVPAHISGRDVLIGSFFDVSELKKDRDVLRQSGERYRAFITDSSDGIFRSESDRKISVTLPADEQITLLLESGYIAECNDAIARMYGFEHAGELAGQKLSLVIDIHDPAMIECMRTFIRNGYQIAGYESEERDPTGRIRWFSSTLNGVVRDGCVTALWGIRRDITGRKKAEVALRQSEEQYRELVNRSIDIMYTIGFSGEITSISPAVIPLLGYQPEEMIGRNILEFIRPESRQYVQEILARKKEGDASDAFFEVYLRAKDDSLIPFDVNMRVRSDGRDTAGIIGIAREIAERKRNEDALKETEERFRILLEYVPSVAVLAFGPDFSIISWNQASAKMFGFTAEEAIGKDIRELLIPPEFRDEVTETCRDMEKTGIPVPLEERDFLNKNRTRVPVFVTLAVVKIPKKSTTLHCIAIDLTERKKAQTALREAEQRLQSILDVAPFGSFVCELHEDGSLVFIGGNRSADRILGTDCTRFIGMTLEEAFPMPAPAGIPEAFRRVIREGKPFHDDAFEYMTVGGSGIFEIHAVPLAQNRMTVFFRDISEKRKAEEELEQSETRFRTLIQNSPDIIQILDGERRLVYSSPALRKILGYPVESQNNQRLLDLIHPDDRERVAADLDEVYSRTNPGVPTEYRMLTADGNSIYVESVGVNLLDVPGVNGIVINTHAVHERKRAEQALIEREERFRLIFEHSNDAMYLFEITASGMPGKIADTNEVAVHQTGYTRDELVQKSLLDLCSRDLSQRSRAIMMELLTRGEARFETETIKKDGSLLPVEMSTRLAKFREKNYVIAISRDISRRKREERALRIANQKLQLMNIVAWHDIQNKITGLMGYVERSKDRLTDEKLKKFMDRGEDVLRIIHRQLQYTREYQEMGIHPPRWVSLPRVLHTIVSVREMGSLKIEMELHDLELFCDPVIEKVFSHLIENTLKHGKKATKIHIACQETATGLVLVYEDDGIGIPVEKKKDLFVPGAGSAAGFSLFFVHDILEISDMTIQETGVPGSGVRFEIAIPGGLYRINRESS